MIWFVAAVSVGIVALAVTAFSYLRVLRGLEKEAFSDGRAFRETRAVVPGPNPPR